MGSNGDFREEVAMKPCTSTRGRQSEVASRLVKRLENGLARIQRGLLAVQELDRRLDCALAYSLDPNANPNLARAYFQLMLKQRADVLERLRFDREQTNTLLTNMERQSSANPAGLGTRA